MLNHGEIAAWMAEQGLESCVTNMHVTLAFDKKPHNWSDLPPETIDEMVIPESDERTVALFRGGAVVLEVPSIELTARWSELLLCGLYWKWEDYRPHITLTYNLPDGVGVHGIEPYDGRILLGPEILEEVLYVSHRETAFGLPRAA